MLDSATKMQYKYKTKEVADADANTLEMNNIKKTLQQGWGIFIEGLLVAALRLKAKASQRESIVEPLALMATHEVDESLISPILLTKAKSLTASTAAASSSVAASE